MMRAAAAAGFVLRQAQDERAPGAGADWSAWEYFWSIPNPAWHWPATLGAVVALGAALAVRLGFDLRRVEGWAWALGLGLAGACAVAGAGTLAGALGGAPGWRLAALWLAAAAVWLAPGGGDHRPLLSFRPCGPGGARAAAGEISIPPGARFLPPAEMTRPRARGRRAAAILLALTAAGTLAGALLAPPLGLDERSYQLVLPALWRAAGTVTAPPDNFAYAFRAPFHLLLAWTDLCRGLFLVAAALEVLAAYALGAAVAGRLTAGPAPRLQNTVPASEPGTAAPNPNFSLGTGTGNGTPSPLEGGVRAPTSGGGGYGAGAESRPYGSPGTGAAWGGWAAVLLVLGAPIFETTTTQGFLEPLIGGLFALAALGVWRFAAGGRGRVLVAAALAAGFAASLKYSAAVPVALAAVPVAMLVWRRAAPGGRARLLAGAAVAAAAFPAAWWTLTAVQYGNPVWPYLHGVFGGRTLGAALAGPRDIGWFEGVGVAGFLTDPFHWSWGVALFPLLIGAVLPRRQVVRGARCKVQGEEAPPSAPRPEGRGLSELDPARWARVLAGLALVWVFVLLAGRRSYNANQLVRFVSPALPVLAAFAVIALARLGRWRPAAWAALALSVLVAQGFAVLHTLDRVPVLVPPAAAAWLPAALQPRDAAWYRARYLDQGPRAEARAIQAANGVRRALAPDAVMAFLWGLPPWGCDARTGAEFCTLLCHDGWVDFAALSEPRDLARRLRDVGVTHLVIGPDLHDDCPVQRYVRAAPGWDQYPHFVTVWQEGPLRILRVLAHAPPGAAPGR